jgi:hypothetical protein
MRAGVVVAAFVALLLAQPATGSSWITMDDGVEIGYQLVLPEGAPPSAGWPVVMLPGGETDAALGELFVHRGFAALLYLTRSYPSRLPRQAARVACWRRRRVALSANCQPTVRSTGQASGGTAPPLAPTT